MENKTFGEKEKPLFSEKTNLQTKILLMEKRECFKWPWNLSRSWESDFKWLGNCWNI